MPAEALNAAEFNLLKKLWSAFFPGDALPTDRVSDNRCRGSAEFLKFFRDEARGKPLLLGAEWRNQGSVYFDCVVLSIALGFHDFLSSLASRPLEITGTMGIALGLLADKLFPYGEPMVIRPRFTNFDPETPYEMLKSSIIGQLVSIKGYVVKVSPPVALVEAAQFVCSACGYDQWVRFPDGIFTPPEMCRGRKDSKKDGRSVMDMCRSKKIEVVRSHCQITQVQTITLQELDDTKTSDQARIPKTFPVEVRGALVSQCVPGNLVKVVGQICSLNVNRGSKTNKQQSGLSTFYMLANSVTTIKGGDSRGAGEGKKDQDANGAGTSAGSADYSTPFSEHELRRIGDIALTDSCLGLLVNSLCPTIFGHDLVKLGLLLGLLGGTSAGVGGGADNINVAANEHEGLRIRSDIHVLVVGDPGLGKSQMLRAAATVAPRAVLVCGNTATTAGLTVAVSREAGGGGVAGGNSQVCLEAGALVLADQGVCCLDELDKMTCDHHALLEAMEQQCVSVAKAGVVTSLHTRTAVLAAANPCQGHYNRRKTVCENLKMPSALLSRFDLVFILMDARDIQHDKRVSEHILKTSALARGTTTGTTVAANKAAAGAGGLAASTTGCVVGNCDGDQDLTISQRLRRHCQAFSDAGTRLLPEELRRYIEYARKYVRPQLTKPAAKVLQKMYLTMRSQSVLGKSIPVTTRNLESLIRLAQARARAELRELVTEQDAQDVVDLLHESLLDAFTNESGALGGDLFSKSGRMGGTQKQVKALVNALKQEAQLRDCKLFHKTQIIEVCRRLRLEKDPEDLISLLNVEGYLLQKVNSSYECTFC